MAASQQVSSAGLSAQENAVFEEVLAVAQSKIASKNKSEDKDQVVTYGFIVNQHDKKTSLQKIDQHDWSGKTVKPYPQIISTQEPGEFEHQGTLPGGSAGGVAYADGDDSTARKWIVAFDNPQKKVYVVAGATGETDWNVIKVNLDQSGYVSRSENPELGVRAVARNYGYAVVVVFSTIPPTHAA